MGVWMRWALAGTLALGLPFEDLRHAHSHLGYFGLLFPLAWMGWKHAGARTPSARALVLYALSTVLATVGFIHAGYGPIAIAGSTAVGAGWVWSAWPLLPRMKQWHDPLGAVPLGLVLSLACVPPVAINLRTDPELAHGFVTTFLAGLLLVVIVPSVLASARVSVGPWPALLLTGSLASLALGVLPNMPTRVGLLAYAALLLAPAYTARLAAHIRACWLGVSLGIAALALGLLPNIRPVALGAIHFLVLGPVLAVLMRHVLRRNPPSWAWWLGHGLWGSMSAALVAQAFTAAAWTWTLAAAGGTGTLLWWAVVGAAQSRLVRGDSVGRADG